MRTGGRRSFTLLEVLAVVALLGLLAALLAPALGGVQRAALAQASRLRLRQWALACETYRLEYRAWPEVTAGAVQSLEGRTPAWVETLSGRGWEGSDYQTAEGAALNPRRVVCHEFREEEFARAEGTGDLRLVDAFGNPRLFLVFDLDGDGRIEPGDLAGVPAARRPVGPLRVPVAGYAANPLEDPALAWVCSWEGD